MSFTGLLVEDVILTTITAGAPDDYGNPTQVTTTASVKGRLWQQSTVENVDGRDVTVTRTILFLAPDAPVTSTSRVAVSGQTFEVDGQADIVYGASIPHHLEVPLKETTA